MKTMVLCVIIFSLFYGCSHNQAVWDHPTKTNQDFYRDSAKCETMANSSLTGYSGFQSSGYGQLFGSIAVRRNWNSIYYSCMMGEGWNLEKVDKEKPRMAQEEIPKVRGPDSPETQRLSNKSQIDSDAYNKSMESLILSTLTPEDMSRPGPVPEWVKFWNRGSVLLESGDYKGAIDAFTKGIVSYKDNIWPETQDVLWHCRGYAYGKLHNYNQAIKDYSAAIHLNPLLAGAYNNRGIIYLELGSYSQAIKDFDSAIELAPETYKQLTTREDIKIAARAGVKEVQDFLRKYGQSWQRLEINY